MLLSFFTLQIYNVDNYSTLSTVFQRQVANCLFLHNILSHNISYVSKVADFEINDTCEDSIFVIKKQKKHKDYFHFTQYNLRLDDI